LRREIIATCVTNATINRAGTTFVHRLGEETGAGSADVVRAYTSVREVFGLPALWQGIEALDALVADEVQARMLLDFGRLLNKATLWFLRQRRGEAIAATVAIYAPGVAALLADIATLLWPSEAQALQARQDALCGAGVPVELARKVASCDALLAALDMIDIAKETGRDVAVVAAVYFALEVKIEHGWLRTQIAALPGESHWDALAKAALEEDIAGQQRALTAAVLRLSPEIMAPDALVDAWTTKNAVSVTRAQQVLADLHGTGALDLAMLSVAMRELRAIAG
jgi:glutamate dehydrogenase